MKKTAVVLSFLPTVAWAHTGAGGGFLAGFAHPFMGLDHLLAMVAVGLWAVQLGGAMRWRLPLAFVACMALGAALPASLGAALEPGIAASVLLLGVAVFTAMRPHAGLAMAVVGAAALLHGHAHGIEMPLAASPLTYGLGLILATALLHGAGVLGGGAVKSAVLRGAGLAIGVAGAGLLLT
jgi:urease accessory protein